MVASFVPTVRYYRLHPLWAVTLPLAACLYLAMTWSSEPCRLCFGSLLLHGLHGTYGDLPVVFGKNPDLVDLWRHVPLEPAFPWWRMQEHLDQNIRAYPRVLIPVFMHLERFIRGHSRFDIDDVEVGGARSFYQPARFLLA